MPPPRRSQASPRRPASRVTSASPRRTTQPPKKPASQKVVVSPRETKASEIPDTIYNGRSIDTIRKQYDSRLSESPDKYIRVTAKGTFTGGSFHSVVSLMRSRDYVIVPELCLYGSRDEVQTFMDTFDYDKQVLDQSVLGSGNPTFPDHPELEALFVSSSSSQSSRLLNVSAREALELLVSVSSAIKKGSNAQIETVTSSGKPYDRSQSTKKTKKAPHRDLETQRKMLIAKFNEVRQTNVGMIRVDSFDEKTLTGASYQRSRISNMHACRQENVSFYGYEDDTPLIRGPREKIRLYIENVLSHDPSLQPPRELHTREKSSSES